MREGREGEGVGREGEGVGGRGRKGREGREGVGRGRELVMTAGTMTAVDNSIQHPVHVCV